MTRVKPLLVRGWALLLLPLSVVPFVLLGPQIAESHKNFDRVHKSGALPAPPVAVSAAEAARWKPLPPYSGAVPVIAYKGLGADAARERHGITRARFARQMEMLGRAGFHTISIHQYSRFRRGLPAGMPSRPVLITFDGGRLDSFRGADRVLQWHGFKATMFVTTGEIQRRNPDYLQWRELKSMQRTGRWDIQPRTARGDRLVPIDGTGGAGDFYAYRRYTKSAGEETFADWQERVSRDLFDARDAMRAQGFDPVAMSLTGGNYGQAGTNDPRIAPWLGPLLVSQFGTVFVDGRLGRPGYTSRTGTPHRYVMHGDETADDLYGWLRDNDPAASPTGGHR